MKTICIAVFHPLITRNILAAGIHKQLARKYRVVVVGFEYKKKYLEEYFGAPNVVVHGVKAQITGRDLFFQKLAFSLSGTRTAYIKKRADRAAGGSLLGLLLGVVPSALSKMRFAQKGMRWIDARCADRMRFKEVFEQYQPDLVFATDVQNEFDVSFLQEAKKRGVRTTGMVRSWDNLTSKGVLRCTPDTLIVHNELIKEEAMKYNYFLPEQVAVVGIPHYDHYRRNPKEERSMFFKRFGFNEQKPLIVLAPIGERYIGKDTADKRALEAVADMDANILVRMPPTDVAYFEGFTPKKANVVFMDTGIRAWKGEVKFGGSKVNEMSADDDKSLIEALSYANLFIIGPSTLTIDAAVFNVPEVAIGFDGEKQPYYKSVRRYYDYDHFKPIRESGGLRIASSPEELREISEEYLRNPKKDEEGRARLKEIETYRLDGRAGERLVAVLEKEVL